MNANGIDGVFQVYRPVGSAIPLVFDSPHSGTHFPDDFEPAVARDQILQCADLYVERLFSGAPDKGAVLLAAGFPRVYVDPNRSEADIDPQLVDDWPGPARPTAKTRLGKGLIWRAIKPNMSPIYHSPLSAAAVQARIERYYRPYHAALAGLLDGAHGATGAVWHVNCHSMQPVSGMMDMEGAGLARSDVVLSDRDGETCDPAFLDCAARSLRGSGLEVAINHPFKGAEIVSRHGRPKENRHSLQIEINRKHYLNLQTLEPNAAFSHTKTVLDQLVSDLADFVTAR